MKRYSGGYNGIVATPYHITMKGKKWRAMRFASGK